MPALFTVLLAPYGKETPFLLLLFEIARGKRLLETLIEIQIYFPIYSISCILHTSWTNDVIRSLPRPDESGPKTFTEKHLTITFWRTLHNCLEDI